MELVIFAGFEIDAASAEVLKTIDYNTHDLEFDAHEKKDRMFTLWYSRRINDKRGRCIDTELLFSCSEPTAAAAFHRLAQEIKV